jgi:hypothetical protein
MTEFFVHKILLYDCFLQQKISFRNKVHNIEWMILINYYKNLVLLFQYLGEPSAKRGPGPKGFTGFISSEQWRNTSGAGEI